MTAPAKKGPNFTLISIIFFLIVAGGLLVGYRYQQLYARMMEMNKGLAPIKEVPAFTMQNQDGESVNPSKFFGHIWLADFVFTRCPGPCLRLTKQFAELQRDLPKDVKFASFSVDPEFDAPAVLKKYGIANGADFNRWSFFTSDKEQMRHVVIKGFMTTMADQTNPELVATEGPVIHSAVIVLIDQKGRIRKYYDGLDPEAIKQLKEAVKYLQETGSETPETKS